MTYCNHSWTEPVYSKRLEKQEKDLSEVRYFQGPRVSTLQSKMTTYFFGSGFNLQEKRNYQHRSNRQLKIITKRTNERASKLTYVWNTIFSKKLWNRTFHALYSTISPLCGRKTLLNDKFKLIHKTAEKSKRGETKRKANKDMNIENESFYLSAVHRRRHRFTFVSHDGFWH